MSALTPAIKALRAEAAALAEEAAKFERARTRLAKCAPNQEALFAGELMLRAQAAAKFSASAALEAEERAAYGIGEGGQAA